MIAREFRTAIKRLGLSIDQVAVFFAIEPQVVDGYWDGKIEIPAAVAMVLRVAAGLGGLDKIEAADRNGRRKLAMTADHRGAI
jgi:hypothetical protein